MKNETKKKQLSTQLIITLAGVAVALLNVWLVAKLSPLSKDLAKLQVQVVANTHQLGKTVTSEMSLMQYKNITERLDRIENKLDETILNNR